MLLNIVTNGAAFFSDHAIWIH